MTHEVEAAVYILRALEEIEKTGDVYAETNNLIRKKSGTESKNHAQLQKIKILKEECLYAKEQGDPDAELPDLLNACAFCQKPA